MESLEQAGPTYRIDSTVEHRGCMCTLAHGNPDRVVLGFGASRVTFVQF